MRRGALIGGVSAIAVALTIVAASPVKAQYGYGQGMMGPGMMGHMMGPGMMGPGMMGQGMMGQGYMPCPGCGMMGPGMMGPGMMGGYGQGYGPGMMGGYGPGMMQGYGQGYGPGMMGPGQYGRQGNLNLSTNDVKNYLERWIAVQGNPRLKVGDVKEKDADTIEADVVTKDNSLVQRFIVNRHTGFYQPSGS